MILPFKVLIVDDNRDWVSILSDYVRGALTEEVIIEAASSYSNARNSLAREKYDLILVDIKLPHSSEGVMLLNYLDDTGIHVPAIVVSLFSHSDLASGAPIHYPVQHYFEKSRLDTWQLTSAISAILKGTSTSSRVEPKPVSQPNQTVQRMQIDITSRSGGVNVDAENVSVGHDVVGRDKIVQNIYNYSPLANTIQSTIGNGEEGADFVIYVGQDGFIHARSEQGEQSSESPMTAKHYLQWAMRLIEINETDETMLKDFGKDLYKLLFPGPIHTHLHQTEAVARSKGQKVHIRLTIEPDTLARLPWEFTFRSSGGYYLSNNHQTALSRYLDLAVPPNRVRRRNGPLHMLIIIANPSDQGALNPNDWEKIVLNALAIPIKEGTITTRTVKRATYEEIQDALLERKPDIVQFVGHGIYQHGRGNLALVDSKTSKSWIVNDELFANIFLSANDNLGLICLATCESATSNSPQSFLGIAPQIVQRGIPAVVAMQYSVLVSTAEIFFESFYKSIAAHKPVDWAVQQARNAVSIKSGLGNREFATPVLYMRAKDGNIF
jgi:CheY-like chemotaxis protein